MDFSFTEEQQDLQGLARRILGEMITDERLREVEQGEVRFDRDVWDALARANLLGISLPEEVGGSGYGVIEQCLVLEEVGRTLAPVPVLASIVTGAAPIARFGSAEQREQWAKPAAEGTVILTAALNESLNRFYDKPQTTATRSGDGWTLTGTKTVVPAATLADRILAPASTDEGVAVFIVDPKGPGVTVTPQKTTDRETDGLLELDGATVGADALLGSAGGGAEIVDWIVDRATLGLCAMQLGVTEEALRRTAAYATERVQFERPIATFQAVGHRCADSYIDVEGIRMTTWQAAWRLSEGLPATTEIEVAKLWAADGGHRVAHAAVHIHGGMGVATEYSIHRYFLAAKQIEFTLGSAIEEKLRIGARLAAEPV